MDENKHIPATEENLKMMAFMRDVMAVFQKYELVQDEPDPEVPHHRAANVLISEVHDWHRSGRMDIDVESFTDYCEAVQEGNYEIDDIEGRYSAGD